MTTSTLTTLNERFHSELQSTTKEGAYQDPEHLGHLALKKPPRLVHHEPIVCKILGGEGVDLYSFRFGVVQMRIFEIL